MWRSDMLRDEDGRLLEAHISPVPEEAAGWDGIRDQRPREYVHWHEQTGDDLRAFYEVPAAKLDALAEALGVDRERDKLSLHDMLAIVELRLT